MACSTSPGRYAFASSVSPAARPRSAAPPPIGRAAASPRLPRLRHRPPSLAPSIKRPARPADETGRGTTCWFRLTRRRSSRPPCLGVALLARAYRAPPAQLASYVRAVPTGGAFSLAPSARSRSLIAGWRRLLLSVNAVNAPIVAQGSSLSGRRRRGLARWRWNHRRRGRREGEAAAGGVGGGVIVAAGRSDPCTARPDVACPRRRADRHRAYRTPSGSSHALAAAGQAADVATLIEHAPVTVAQR